MLSIYKDLHSRYHEKCEVHYVFGWIVGIAVESLKSHSIPRQKLSQNSGQVSYINFATVAFLHFNKGRLRREFERKDFFYLVNIVKKPCYYNYN